jgi:hypothetical protein
LANALASQFIVIARPLSVSESALFLLPAGPCTAQHMGTNAGQAAQTENGASLMPLVIDKRDK